MEATSASVSSRRTFPGLPMTSDRAGILAPSVIERPGGDDGILRDLGAIQHDGAHPDEHAVVQRAAVDDSPMPNGHLVADARGMSVAHHVDDCAVLNVRAPADGDAVDVSADHHVHPDTAVLPDRDVSNELRRFIDVRRRVHLWIHPAIGSDHPFIIVIIPHENHPR